jgi:3-methyladenine DNA glycosylase AlkC
VKEKFEMKEAAFNTHNITQLADNILAVDPEFNKQAFLNSILPHLHSLELKERSNLIEETLITTLPDQYERAVSILLDALPLEIADQEVTGYEGFILMPQTGFVAKCGMNHFELSMEVLYEMTKRFTAEFHIRYFIEAHYEKTMAQLKVWSSDTNVHVRRLVSEGTRPRLPWAFVLKEFVSNPQPVIKLLELLKDDSELYVRRSVANNLNDISKDHPQIVTQTLKAWQNGSKEMAWLTKHALRTLLKKGDPEALALLGFKKSEKLEVSLKLDQSTIILGESLLLEVNITSNETEVLPMMIDYVVHYQKANGTLSPKVFKLSSKTMQAGANITLNKKQKIADFSTRKHYAGEHKVSLLINGQPYEEQSFTLLISDR